MKEYKLYGRYRDNIEIHSYCHPMRTDLTPVGGTIYELTNGDGCRKFVRGSCNIKRPQDCSERYTNPNGSIGCAATTTNLKGDIVLKDSLIRCGRSSLHLELFSLAKRLDKKRKSRFKVRRNL